MLLACLLPAMPLAMAGENPRLQYALGILAESRGDEHAANSHFENARRADPLAAPLVSRAVTRLLAAGDRASAIRLRRELATARPDELPIQLSYADFLTDQGRGDAMAQKLAIEALDAVLVRHPGHPQIIRRLASLDRARAAALIRTLADNDPEAVLLYTSLTRSLHDADDPEARAETDRRFLAAIAARPENAQLARAASDHFRETSRPDQAMAVLERHTASAPWSLDLRVRLGILNFAAKRYDVGERTLLEVLAIHPRKALAHQALAKFYRLKGDSARASHHAGELLKIRGGDPAEFLKLAGEHLDSGRPREARLLLEKAVYESPQNVELRMKLALASHRDPQTRTRAARLFREAEAVSQNGTIADPAFLLASAEALIEAGQGKAAENRLRAAIRAWPPTAKRETAATLRRLAALWEDENRNLEAARALRHRADALDPPTDGGG